MIKKLFFLSFMVGLSAGLLAQNKKGPQAAGKNPGKAEDGVSSKIYQNWAVTKSGIKYKIHESNASERKVAEGDFLFINMRAIVLRTDSVLFDTYAGKKEFVIPFNEPTLGSVFAQLRKGDSASFVIIADSLFTNSFNQPLPDGLKAGDKLLFHSRLVGLYTQEELNNVQENKNLELRIKDSVDLKEFVASDKKWKVTESGLYYQIVNSGNGKKAVTGDQVTVSYVGKFINGEVFDKSDEKNPEFTFTKDNQMVIPGFDEGIGLLEEGGSAKFIIPWQLAYGPNGSGPIQPYTSLIFEIKLLKIKSK